MSIKGYQTVTNITVEGRALQARALLRCAQALNEGKLSQDVSQLVAAATNNARLWLFFYSEIEAGNVTLPREVASNIVSLAAYVAKVTVRAMSGEEKVLDTLISINRNIAAGLSEGTPETAPPPAAAAGLVTSA